MNRPPFPAVIDSSLIAAFRACPTQCFNEYFLHLKAKTPSVHLHAGAAFARGLEIARKAYYLEGKSESDALEAGMFALFQAYGDFECPEDSNKSATRMAGALDYYFEQYPMGKDKCVPASLPGGAKGIEFSFVEPINVSHPETGEPLLYSGRFDMLANFANALYGEDDKTTSQLGASWSRQWDLRSQFTAYCWGAKRAGFPIQGFLVRGVSILKNKYETQQAITYRPDWQIDRWYTQVLKDLDRMKAMWVAGEWEFNLSESCNTYGGCQFKKLCMSSDPSPWIEADFARRRWDPVTRTETPIVET